MNSGATRLETNFYPAISKTFLRNFFIKKRKRIPLDERKRKSKKILRKLSKTSEFLKAKNVAFYFSEGAEVETQKFIEKIISQKEVYLPRTLSKGKMEFRRVDNLSEDIEKGELGIWEPKGTKTRRLISEMDIIIVPGVAFDLNGGRLGRGAGYYDCALKRAKKVCKIGLAFTEQIAERIPMTPQDVKMNKVITD